MQQRHLVTNLSGPDKYRSWGCETWVSVKKTAASLFFLHHHTAYLRLFPRRGLLSRAQVRGDSFQRQLHRSFRSTGDTGSLSSRSVSLTATFFKQISCDDQLYLHVMFLPCRKLTLSSSLVTRKFHQLCTEILTATCFFMVYRTFIDRIIGQ